MQIEAYCADTLHYNILQRFIDINPNSLWGPKCEAPPYDQCDPNDTDGGTGYNSVCGLDINDNNISCISTSPSEWSNTEWWEEGKLVELDLAANQLHSHIPEELGNIETLRILRLEGNELTGEIPNSLSNLSSLSRLDLSSNKLSGSIPESIGSLATIDTLSLADNNIGCYDYNYSQEDGEPFDPYGFDQESCKIHCDETDQCYGGIPESLLDLSGVEHVDLQQNNLSGAIPNNIDNLLNMERLYLNENRFSGSIPISLGNIPVLSQLHLHFNQLSGTIPESLCNIYSNTDINTMLYLQSNNLCPNALPDQWPACMDLDSIGNMDDQTNQWNVTQNMAGCQ